MKIMIVDDSVRMRQMIRDVLKNFVSEFYECSDGRGVLAGFEIFKPDIVLMDIKMTNIDGITATRQIMKKYPKAKIYIVTNYDDQFLKEDAEKAGASGYILKDDLFKIIHVIKMDIAK